MDSAQGLLSFISNASRQIKTYLGPEQQKKTVQGKTHQQQLLLQLSKLKTQNYNFIPDIIEASSSSTTYTTENCSDSIPASPTPSLDSVGSHDDRDDTPKYGASCLIKSRRQKRMLNTAKLTTLHSNSPIVNKRTKFQTQQPSSASCVYSSTNSTFVCSSNFDHRTAPSPSPDFEDLMECMLTEDALANIDVNNYFAPL